MLYCATNGAVLPGVAMNITEIYVYMTIIEEVKIF